MSTTIPLPCCRKGRRTSQMHVIVGEHNRSRSEGTESTLAIEKIVMHPRYSNDKFRNNDIALVRLKGRIKYSRKVAPVCLPMTDVSPATVCVATGWGVTRGT